MISINPSHPFLGFAGMAGHKPITYFHRLAAQIRVGPLSDATVVGQERCGRVRLPGFSIATFTPQCLLTCLPSQDSKAQGPAAEVDYLRHAGMPDSYGRFRSLHSTMHIQPRDSRSPCRCQGLDIHSFIGDPVFTMQGEAFSTQGRLVCVCYRP